MAESDFNLVDGSLDFSGGVNSYSVTTIQSEKNPNGLRRNQVAWADNCTMRGGGICQRTGWVKIGVINCQLGKYQGSIIYNPLWDNLPYLVSSIGGRIYKIDVDDPASAVELTAVDPLLVNPSANEVSYFLQAEQFLIVQAGDYVTNPLFWDGTTLRRSKGITDPGVASGTPNTNEIPAAGPMDYYMNRIWYAQGRTYSAGDIVGGPSGVIIPSHVDSILNVTENPLCVGGDGFSVPSGTGNIRCLTHTSNINATLGEGQLMIFTRKDVFAMTVPVTRSDWVGADTNARPLQTVVQMNNGAVNARSMVAVNGDLFFQSFEPSIRSLVIAMRYYDQWGNTPISINENRILAFNDRGLMRFASGILFDNRVLQCVLPFETPVGVAHKAVVPLNFDVISTLDTKLPPVWEGMYEGLDILELVSSDFAGRERAFAIAWSEEEQNIQLWELTNYSKTDRDDNRVAWYIETPAYTWGDEFQLKKLVSAELWIDKLFGKVFFEVDYRVDGDPCWYPWHKWNDCTSRSTCEDVHNPSASPYCEPHRESFRQTVTLPKPQPVCEAASGRPTYIGYQFQVRIRIKGWCRIRGLLLKAEKVEQKLYHNMVCK